MIRFATVLALGCALAACKDSDPPPAPAPATETTPIIPPKEPIQQQAAAPAQAPVALPAGCTEYKLLVGKLAECEKLPAETREGLRKAFEQSWAGWERAADRSAIEGECTTAAQNLHAAVAAACSW